MSSPTGCAGYRARFASPCRSGFFVDEAQFGMGGTGFALQKPAGLFRLRLRRASMVVFTMRVVTAPARRDALMALLEALLEPTRVEPGCLDCRLYADKDDAAALTLVEEWSSQQALDRHLRSDARKSLIATMELSAVAPVVRFDTLMRREGMEAIEQALQRGTTAA
jgi:quinol monooxygenase YgiN